MRLQARGTQSDSSILLIFFGCLLFAFVYVFFFIPETKGISLEEVDELYRTGVKPWKSSNWTPTVRRSAMDAMESGRRPSDMTMVEKEKKAEGAVVHREHGEA